jgi:ribonuclease G
MQSAFVDIGLERDAFLYVSDFMELEEHDDDLTDVIPANRGVQDMRPQPARTEAAAGTMEPADAAAESQSNEEFESDQELTETETQGDAPQPLPTSGVPDRGSDSQNRDR